MAHPHGLVQNQLTFDTVALGTLGSRNNVNINAQFVTPTASFLMKRIRYYAQLVGRTAADDGPIVIGCARGDATISEVSEAMNERNVNGPDDITNMLDQDKPWVVYQNTVVPMIPGAALTEAWAPAHWLRFNKKTGIPLIEGAGMQIFAFNCGSGALATGSSINGIAHLQGVWLRD